MVSICQTYVSAPFGYVRVLSSIDCVTKIELLACRISTSTRLNKFALEAREQIKAYLKNPNFKFDLPIDIQGSSYRKRVWSEILRIPVRETRTYSEIAAFMGSSARAVGSACGDNRLPLLIPCHRVVAQSGLGGYMHASIGFSLKVKWWLLHHEASLAN